MISCDFARSFTHSSHLQGGDVVEHGSTAAGLSPLYRIYLNEDIFPHHEPGEQVGWDDSSTEGGDPSMENREPSGHFTDYVGVRVIYFVEVCSRM